MKNEQHCKSCFPAGNSIFKESNRNTPRMCEMYSKLTIKTPERLQWHRFSVFIVNFEHISDFGLVFLCIVTFEQVNAGWIHISVNICYSYAHFFLSSEMDTRGIFRTLSNI